MLLFTSSSSNSITTITMLLLVMIISFSHMIPSTQAQQEYVNNKQLDCDTQYNTTYGNVCNSVTSCQSYLTFKSSSPEYNTPSSISYLLNSTPSLVAKSNNITDVTPIITDTMVTVPVTCSCSGGRYQHNATYNLKKTGETYFSIANNTYQSLTTCQALMAQNPYDAKNLFAGDDLHVPLRCACPTKKQSDAGFKYLLTYLVSQGESPDSIAEIFGVDTQSVLDANELDSKSVVFYFTPLLVPLKTEPPARLQIAASPPESPPPAPAGNDSSSSSKKWVIVGVTVGVAVCLVVALLVFFLCFYNRRRRQPAPPPVSVKDFPDSAVKMVSETTPTTESWSLSSEGVRYAIESLTAYKFGDIQTATKFFSEENKIKGSVYRASFKGDDAAVKILNGDVSAEINLLKRINHANIIRLSGFCVHKGNTYLVYEFAENDSLDDWLHSDKKYQNSVSLSWMQRVQIAYDVADALNYLHNYTNPIHIHKNLKSGNVLLDGKFRAKVSNFGLARVMEDQGEDGGFQMTRHVVGTQGYMPPEYIESGLITPKMDVFAFGVVMLELLSGREATSSGEKNGLGENKMLSETVNHVLEGDNVRDKLRGFMDPTLRDEYPLDLAYSMAEIAKRCVAHDLNSRPNISEVLMTLSKVQSTTLDWDPSDELERSRSVSQISES
ncbi:protein LYK5-like [Lotus japonicus]|uniref:LysM type receptor kinase n=1 Tax=Lotus japonicus TaxID=34305 RepID=D3KU01_LOTJA|nr:protein LYK5-like [Lotus japonicus]BAI79278.1 LysM type receptor kinase [Lotus japonicus]